MEEKDAKLTAEEESAQATQAEGEGGESAPGNAAGASDARCEGGVADADTDAHPEEDATEEVFELEVDEDSIVGYIVDEDDNEIGLIVLDEAGQEQEFYYVNMDEYEVVDEEPEEEVEIIYVEEDKNEYDLGITREGVAEATVDVNAIYKDGIQIAAELKSTFDDINESFSFFKKK